MLDWHDPIPGSESGRTTGRRLHVRSQGLGRGAHLWTDRDRQDPGKWLSQTQTGTGRILVSGYLRHRQGQAGSW
jgi:hypothetical protein